MSTIDSNGPGPIRGRGASHNPGNRFIPLYYEEDPARVDPDGPAPTTQFFQDHSRSIIATNDSPDIPFTHSLNPYRGCEHGCVYCLSGDTPILMADGLTRPLSDLKVGDEIYGTERRGWYRRFVPTRILAHWRAVKPAYRIRLADGTILIAGPDHRFLTERGWKFVTGMERGFGQRPFLTINNKLMGVGAFARPPKFDHDYRCGYLCGMIRGDGLLGHYEYSGKRRANETQHHFRLVLVDGEALTRTADYLLELGIPTNRFTFQKSLATRKQLDGIRTHVRTSVDAITQLIGWPHQASANWRRGFLAGIFDAEGSLSDTTLRISNTDSNIIQWITDSLDSFSYSYVVEFLDRPGLKPIKVLRLRGGLKEQLRFLHSNGTAIARKRSIAGQAVKSNADLRVVSIEPYAREMELFDITTGTGDFIADGVISHNCYARPFHEYLGFSAGLDFETRIMVKPEAPELLRKELMSPKWKPVYLAMSGVTDCYQPIERRLQVTRRCLQVLVEFRNPVGIVTKSHLVTRDADLLSELAKFNASSVYLGLTTLDAELARKLEPRAASPLGRLQAIAELAKAGVPVNVIIAPVIPGLTDHEIPAILEAAAEAGARSAAYTMLRLPFAVKDLFQTWLEQHFPEKKEKVLSRVRELRGGKLNESNFGARMKGQGPWADLIRSVFNLHRERLGLARRGPELSIAAFRRPGERSLFDAFEGE